MDIFIYIYIYENLRQSTKIYTRLVSLMMFFKCVQSLPFFFSYLTFSKYEVDVMLRTRYFRRFYNLSLFIEKRFEFIHEIIFIRFF